MEADSLDTPEDADMDCVEEEVECLLDDRPQRVIEGLFIGSAWAEMNKPALQKAGITDILQVAQGLFPRHPLCYKYMVLQVEDSPTTDLVCYFPRCFEFIDAARNQGGSVLVHCAAGVSRSATVVLGYLMAREGLSLTAALEHLKAVRPWVAPNPGFMQQLAAYEAAGCDLSDWTPWHVVWYQQQQQDSEAALQQQQELQQQQHWLKLPQPCDKSTQKQEQQQQQVVRHQHRVEDAAELLQLDSNEPPQPMQAAAAACGSSSSAASSISHASLAGLSAPPGGSGIGSGGSNGPGAGCCGSNGGCGYGASSSMYSSR